MANGEVKRRVGVRAIPNRQTKTTDLKRLRNHYGDNSKSLVLTSGNVVREDGGVTVREARVSPFPRLSVSVSVEPERKGFGHVHLLGPRSSS